MTSTKKEQRTVNILGFSMFGSDFACLLKKIKLQLTQKKEPEIIFTPNAEQLVQAAQNPNFSRYLQQADLLLPDGMSVVWASRLLALFGRSRPILQRVTGIDLAWELLELARQQKFQVLVIGGEGYHQLAVSGKKSSKYSRLWHLSDNLLWTPGFQDRTQPTRPEQANLAKILQNLQPAVVLVALGAPYQEKWLSEQRQLLNSAQVKLALSVGGAMDVILGKLNRAPLPMRRLGLEWLYRLVQEPWRWRRQLRLLQFGWLILKQLTTGYQVPEENCKK